MTLLDGPLAALVKAVQTGETSAEALAIEALNRVEARNPEINAICGISPAALNEAQNVDDRL